MFRPLMKPGITWCGIACFCLAAVTAWSYGHEGHPSGNAGKSGGGGGGGGGGFRGASPPVHSGGAGSSGGAQFGGNQVHAPGANQVHNVTGGLNTVGGSNTSQLSGQKFKTESKIQTGGVGIHGATGVVNNNNKTLEHHAVNHGANPVNPGGSTAIRSNTNTVINNDKTVINNEKIVINKGNTVNHSGNNSIHGGVHVEGHPHNNPAYIHDTHHDNMLHSPGPHWNGYHQAYVGNHPVHLAYAGYHPSYYYHPWYHGPWRGYAFGWGWGFSPGATFGVGGAGWGLTVGNPYGPYGYWGYPLGWGYGGWGLGRTVYTSGYYPYYNPYYNPVVYQTVVYNYSNPIPVATVAPAGDVQPTVDPAFDAARQAFQVGDYDGALANVDIAISRNAGDAVYHEFRALALFAKQDYRQAAAVLHSVLAVGPGWDWTTMSSLYPDPNIYTAQLRQLEQYTVANSQAADAHFVLGYHYMIGGHKDAAAAQLQWVVNLIPNDRLAGELLRMVSGPPTQSNPAAVAGNGTNFTPDPPATGDAPAAPTPDPIDKSRLPGTWRASRPDGSNFLLVLTPDGMFQWQYSGANQKGDQFGGTYSVDGAVLILERKEGGALAGTALFSNDSHFRFTMVGAAPDDKGLSFSR